MNSLYFTLFVFTRSLGIGLRQIGVLRLTAVMLFCFVTPSVFGRVIHLVVEADSTMKAFEVKHKFETARNSTEGFNFEAIQVEPIAPEAYLLLDSLVRRGLLELGEVEAKEGGVLIEPVRGEPGVWSINLGSSAYYLDEAIVCYASDEDAERKDELAPESRDRVDAKLRYHSPGCYLLKLESGVSPRSVMLRMTSEGGEQKETSVIWPRVGRCYMVTLSGVVGDEENLFRSLQDKTKVGDPIKQLFPSTSTLIVGSFKEKDPWLKPGFVSLRYPMPAGRAPSRLWLRFPLTEEQEKAVCAQLDGLLGPANGFTQLPGWLKSHKMAANQTLGRNANGWIEVPYSPQENAFVIDVPIDTRDWQELFRNSPERVGDRAVLAWEWQDPSNQQFREILRVGGPGGKRYQSDRFSWWLQGLPTAPLPKKE